MTDKCDLKSGGQFILYFLASMFFFNDFNFGLKISESDKISDT